jgi:uncharacterized FlgJ-related protein
MKILATTMLLLLGITGACAPNENEVYCYIKKIGIRNPEIVLQQAIYESGHFKSQVCCQRNNLFGFRSTLIYKKYPTWQNCVDYYKKWQDRHYTDTTEEYYHFLQRINYSGYKEFNYAKQLKKVKIQASCKCIEDEQPNSPPGANYLGYPYSFIGRIVF